VNVFAEIVWPSNIDLSQVCVLGAEFLRRADDTVNKSVCSMVYFGNEYFSSRLYFDSVDANTAIFRKSRIRITVKSGLSS